ncbi:MAG: metalloregulator ArsR/SmtB family transcription factor [Pseudolysinimonas sp.]
MPGPAQNDAGDAFEALADANRRAILNLVGAKRLSVQEIADAMPISRPAVSRHLRVLAGAGLVVEERQGTRHLFSLHAAGAQAVREYLERIWGDSAARFTIFAENTEDGR